MGTSVIIKANSKGIRVILDDEATFPELLYGIKDKLYKSVYDDKKSGVISISFEGKYLTDAELETIMKEINSMDTTHVTFALRKEQKAPVIPPHQHKNRTASLKSHANFLHQENNPGNMFYFGTLKKGTTLECKKSIIVLGDVKKGATIISNGNIIITGTLKGTAIAGCDLKEKRFVLAQKMEPVHIKIGRNEEHFNSSRSAQFHTNDAVIAYCENGQMIFDTLSHHTH